MAVTSPSSQFLILCSRPGCSPGPEALVVLPRPPAFVSCHLYFPHLVHSLLHAETEATQGACLLENIAQAPCRRLASRGTQGPLIPVQTAYLVAALVTHFHTLAALNRGSLLLLVPDWVTVLHPHPILANTISSASF